MRDNGGGGIRVAVRPLYGDHDEGTGNMTTPTTELTGAALLREAARVIRKDWRNEESRHFAKARAYNLAVADWLEREANFAVTIDADTRATDTWCADALTVARAYLGLS